MATKPSGTPRPAPIAVEVDVLDFEDGDPDDEIEPDDAVEDAVDDDDRDNEADEDDEEAEVIADDEELDVTPMTVTVVGESVDRQYMLCSGLE